MDFRYKIMRFMSGRYGIDTFFYVLFFASAAFAIANIFARSLIIQIVVYLIIIYAIFRVFSRNISARAAENNKVKQILGYFRRKTDFYRQKKADHMHVYKKCPKCHAVLRLPRRKGTHNTICPKCGNRFSVKVYRD